jgi:hypothetical protein
MVLRLLFPLHSWHCYVQTESNTARWQLCARGIGAKRLIEGNGRSLSGIYVVPDFVRPLNEATEVKMAWVSGWLSRWYGPDLVIKHIACPTKELSTRPYYSSHGLAFDSLNLGHVLSTEWNIDGSKYAPGQSIQNACQMSLHKQKTSALVSTWHRKKYSAFFALSTAFAHSFQIWR